MDAPLYICSVLALIQLNKQETGEISADGSNQGKRGACVQLHCSSRS